MHSALHATPQPADPQERMPSLLLWMSPPCASCLPACPSKRLPQCLWRASLPGRCCGKGSGSRLPEARRALQTGCFRPSACSHTSSEQGSQSCSAPRQALEPAMPLAGKRVLVHGGAGGVGSFAIQVGALDLCLTLVAHGYPAAVACAAPASVALEPDAAARPSSPAFCPTAAQPLASYPPDCQGAGCARDYHVQRSERGVCDAPAGR